MPPGSAPPGCACEARRYDGQLHGFFQMGGVMDRGKQAIDDAAAALRAALGQPAGRSQPGAGLTTPPSTRPQGIRPLRSRASG